MQMVQSRQQNVSSSNANKNSNMTAKSAQLKKLNSGNNQNLAQNFSMELAAKNLKMIGGSNMVDIVQPPTRNSNLLSQPNKEKLGK